MASADGRRRIMIKYFWFAIAIAGIVYGLSGLISGEVVFSSTSRINGRELKPTGLPAILMSLCSISAAAAFGFMGAMELGLSPLFEKLIKPALFATLAFFLATVAAVLLR